MTTTRWKVLDVGGNGKDYYIVEEHNGNCVAACRFREYAAQIVREHNAHATMVQALEQARKHIPTDAMYWSNGDYGKRMYISDDIEAALRLAKGG